jgi:hypothetical protein
MNINNNIEMFTKYARDSSSKKLFQDLASRRKSMGNNDEKNGRMTLERIEAIKAYLRQVEEEKLSNQKKVIEEPKASVNLDPFLQAQEAAILQKKTLTAWLEEAILEKIRRDKI